MMLKLLSHRSLLAALFPVVLAGAGSMAHAQPAPQPDRAGPEDPYDADDPADIDDYDAPDQAAPMQAPPMQAPSAEAAPAQPPAPQPDVQPPAPPANPPPMQAGPQYQAQPGQPAPTAGGQWVFTQQYGWLWMPYGDQYVYTPQATTGVVYPYEYVYRPVYGWTWITAPWVWGWGPRVYFSIGPRYYGWHHRPFFGHRVFGGFRGGVRVPFRGGFRGHISPGHFGRGHFSFGHRGHR